MLARNEKKIINRISTDTHLLFHDSVLMKTSLFYGVTEIFGLDFFST